MAKVRALNIVHGPGKVEPRNGISNEEYAKTDTRFAQACAGAGVQPTPRQASKWRNGHGSARKYYERTKNKLAY